MALPLPSHVVAQFPPPTWIENIAVRPNGNLLLTLLNPTASIYELSGPTSQQPSVTWNHTFTDAAGLLGITETEPDIFVTVGLAGTGGAIVYSVDFNGVSPGGEPGPATNMVAVLENATIPNGLTAFPQVPTTVLIADSGNGLVWIVDTLTSKFDIFLQVPEMAPSAAVPVGVNGLHVHDDHLYFSNSATATIYRVPVAADGSLAQGAAVETVAKLDAVFLDDFAFGKDGTLYVATNKDNRLIALKPDCKGGYSAGVVVAGAVDSQSLAGDTSAAFGRTPGDKKVLYVATAGNATVQAGGKVVAIDTTGF